MRQAHGVIGRVRERELIAAFLRAEPCPRALIVEAEAGAGKTALLRWAADEVDGAAVLACWPAEAEAALPFAALGDLLRAHIDDVLPQLPRPQRRALAGALFLDDAAPEVSGAHVVGAALLSGVTLLARERPVLLVVDDAQWLDAGSAEVLTWVVRRLPDGRPVRLLAARRVVPGQSDALPLDLERAVPSGALQRLRLEPLDADAILELVRTHAGTALPAADARRVAELAGGNPFFALELARAPRRALPGTLRELVESRLARLPATTTYPLAICAHLARPTVRSVAAALGADDAWPALAPAIDDDVIRVDEGAIRFAHPLLAEAARAALAASQERQLHARLAEVAPTREERAAHRARSTDPPDEATAVELEEAAQDAERRGAPAVAADLGMAGLRFTDAAPAVRVRRVLLASECLFRSGQMDRANALLRTEAELLPAGPARARVVCVAISRAQEPASRAEVEAALSEAGDDPTALTEAWLALGSLEIEAADWGAAAAAGRRALEHAERADVTAAALAYGWTGFVLLSRAEPEAERLLQRARELEQLSGRLIESDISPDIGLGQAWTFADRLDDARDVMERRLALAIELGDDTVSLGASYHLAELEWRAGRWDAAAAHATRAERLSEQAGESSPWCGWVRGLVAASRGDDAWARPRLEDGLAICLAESHDLWALFYRWALGFLELSCGAPEAALTHLDLLPPAWERVGVVELGVSHHASDELEALILVGRYADAERRIEEEAARAERLDRDRLRGVVARARGMLGSRRGDHATALSELLQAERLHGAGLLPLDHGRSLLALGSAQRRAGHRRDARETLEHALAVHTELGARPWVAATRAEIERIGGRAASGDELTPTERRVASLVAGGRTNREVAEELVVSVRAVEANLTRVYAKLGLRSRAELASRYRGEG